MNKKWLATIMLILSCFVSKAQTIKTVKVGVYDNKPKVFINENGEPDGFFVHLLNDIATNRDLKLDYKQVTFGEGLRDLETGQLDIMPDVVINPDRSKRFVMNRVTILENWASFYIHKDQEPDYYTHQDLVGHTIGVMELDDNYATLKIELGADSTAVRFKVYGTYDDIMKAIESGDIEMGLVNFFFGVNHRQEYEVQQLEMVVNPSSIHIAGNAKSGSIIHLIDQELIDLKHDKDSKYYSLIEEWLDPNPPFRFPQWLTILLLVLAIIFFIALMGMLYLQTQLRANRIKLDFSNKLLKQQITEKSKIENSLRIRNEELFSTNQALDHFIYQLSHNLRAPIASVSGLINLGKIEPDRFHTHIDKMETSLMLLDKTIGDIMTYYRNQRVSVTIEEIDLPKIIDDVLSSVNFQINDAGIKVEISKNIDAACYGDVYRIRSIIHNLVSNAIKYQSPYRQEKCMDIDLEVNARRIKIKVADNGIGISEDQQDKIFDMFHRATDKGQGAGLGLYILKESVEKLNGSVEVSSNENGTTFIVTIPNKKAT